MLYTTQYALHLPHPNLIPFPVRVFQVQQVRPHRYRRQVQAATDILARQDGSIIAIPEPITGQSR